MTAFRGVFHVGPILLAGSLSACANGVGGATGLRTPLAPRVGEQIAQLETDGNLPQLDRSSELKGLRAANSGIHYGIDA